MSNAIIEHVDTLTEERYARLMGNVHADGRPDFVHRLEWMRDVNVKLDDVHRSPLWPIERDVMQHAYVQGATADQFVTAILAVRDKPSV